jgi:hypothetical protein
MTSVTGLAQTLQTLFTTTADQLAMSTGCIRRHRKLSGATLVQSLVLGWLQPPEASLHQLAQMAATLGGAITPQGIDHRFTKETATFLKQVREVAVTQVLASDPVAIPRLQRFPAVMIQESSLVLLPAPFSVGHDLARLRQRRPPDRDRRGSNQAPSAPGFGQRCAPRAVAPRRTGP